MPVARLIPPAPSDWDPPSPPAVREGRLPAAPTSSVKGTAIHVAGSVSLTYRSNAGSNPARYARRRVSEAAIRILFIILMDPLMLILEKYSLGVGDRFAHQAKAQLQACAMAAARGVNVIPVWNKSNREHGIVGSEPGSVRAAADAAVRQAGWTAPLSRGCRPHQSDHRGPLHRRQRFLHARRGLRHRPGGGRRPGRSLLRSPSRAVGHGEHPRRQRALHHRPRRAGEHRPQVPGRRPAGRRHLPAHRPAARRPALHHRSIDGRDRCAADAAGVAGDSGRHRRRTHPHPDHRPQIHRPLQQGRGLRGRRGAVREGIQRRPGGDRPRRGRTTACPRISS